MNLKSEVDGKIIAQNALNKDLKTTSCSTHKKLILANTLKKGVILHSSSIELK